MPRAKNDKAEPKPLPTRPHDFFHIFAHKTSTVVGSPWAFAFAVTVIVVWAALGPVFKYSDTWQLIINTGTTIVTFLMVFLIQNTQNRDAKAIHLKLNELLRGVKGARTSLVDLEDLSDKELEDLHVEFQELHAHYHEELKSRIGAVQDELGERRSGKKGRSRTNKQKH